MQWADNSWERAPQGLCQDTFYPFMKQPERGPHGVFSIAVYALVIISTDYFDKCLNRRADLLHIAKGNPQGITRATVRNTVSPVVLNG